MHNNTIGQKWQRRSSVRKRADTEEWVKKAGGGAKWDRQGGVSKGPSALERGEAAKRLAVSGTGGADVIKNAGRGSAQSQKDRRWRSGN